MAHANSLRELEGGEIVLLAPIFHATKMKLVVLHRVDDGGLWIENREMSQTILEKVGLSMAPKTLVFFLPWAQITWIMNSIDAPTISDRLAD